MSNSYYALSPKKDIRYARSLAMSEKSEVNQFKRKYELALERNDRRHFQIANSARAEVMKLKVKIEGMLDKFKIDQQVELSKILERLREALRTHPELEIPPPPSPHSLLVDRDPFERLNPVAVSDIVGPHGNPVVDKLVNKSQTPPNSYVVHSFNLTDESSDVSLFSRDDGDAQERAEAEDAHRSVSRNNLSESEPEPSITGGTNPQQDEGQERGTETSAAPTAGDPPSNDDNDSQLGAAGPRVPEETPSDVSDGEIAALYAVFSENPMTDALRHIIEDRGAVDASAPAADPQPPVDEPQPQLPYRKPPLPSREEADRPQNRSPKKRKSPGARPKNNLLWSNSQPRQEEIRVSENDDNTAVPGLQRDRFKMATMKKLREKEALALKVAEKIHHNEDLSDREAGVYSWVMNTETDCTDAEGSLFSYAASATSRPRSERSWYLDKMDPNRRQKKKARSSHSCDVLPPAPFPVIIDTTGFQRQPPVGTPAAAKQGVDGPPDDDPNQPPRGVPTDISSTTTMRTDPNPSSGRTHRRNSTSTHAAPRAPQPSAASSRTHPKQAPPGVPSDISSTSTMRIDPNPPSGRRHKKNSASSHAAPGTPQSSAASSRTPTTVLTNHAPAPRTHRPPSAPTRRLSRTLSLPPDSSVVVDTADAEDRPAGGAATPDRLPVSPGGRPPSVGEQIMKATVERECRAILQGIRPPKELKFNGDLNKIDYESHMLEFRRAMKQPGITDEIIIHELPHWFSGVALGVIKLFNYEEDCTVQYKLITDKLNKKYGHKKDTLDNLLDKIVKGPTVKENDQKAIEFFINELEKFAIDASRTDRLQLLDSADTINRIVNARIPSVTARWAKECCKKLNRGGEIDPRSRVATFDDFIEFLTNQAQFQEIFQTIKKRKDDTKAATSEKKPASKQPAKDAAVAATGASPTTTQPNKGGGRRKRGKGKGQKSANPPTNEQSVAATSANGASGARPTGGRRNGGGGRNSNGRPSNGRPVLGRGQNGSPANNHQTPTAPKPPASRPQANNDASTTQRWACVLCKSTTSHKANVCPEFLKASISQRHAMMRAGGLCYRCFDRGHLSRDCEVEGMKCDKCGMTNHHTVFHTDRRPSPDNE